jgi:type II secretory pathway component PulM
MTRTRRLLAWSGAALALSVVFVAYLDPHLMVDLANRVWACF